MQWELLSNSSAADSFQVLLGGLATPLAFSYSASPIQAGFNRKLPI
jgi:hypothetical protein